MKIPISNLPAPGSAASPRTAGRVLACGRRAEDGAPHLTRVARPAVSAFTMIEIAISLAIIGFALVAILGVLPIGMNSQRDNRQETIVNQDATVLLEAMRTGAHGLDYLTNYVYAITNTWTQYNTSGGVINSGQNGYTYGSVSIGYTNGPYSSLPITNGAAIIGLLSTPEFIANVQTLPDTNYPAVPGFLSVGRRYGNVGCFSNHVVAYVYSLSGLAADRPPQNNAILIGGSFAYRLYCVNAPMAVDTNTFNLSAQASFATQLAANQRELRMTFLWPLYANGKTGPGRHTFRATIAGQLQPAKYWGQPLYFYQPQSFTNSP